MTRSRVVEWMVGGAEWDSVGQGSRPGQLEVGELGKCEEGFQGWWVRYARADRRIQVESCGRSQMGKYRVLRCREGPEWVVPSLLGCGSRSENLPEVPERQDVGIQLGTRQTPHHD